MNDEGPKTLIEAVRYFSDKKVCHDYMVKIKWPDGKIVCPKCGGDNIGFLATREIYKCRGCKKQFSCKVDTIFEGSPLGLDKWFVAIWMESNCKNGISSLSSGFEAMHIKYFRFRLVTFNLKLVERY